MAASGFPSANTQSTVDFDRTSQQLRPVLERLAARFNQRQLRAALVRALAVGFALCAVLMLLHRLYLADVTPFIIAVILGASALIGWRNGTVERANVFRAALDADRALGLNDRLSSAAAFAFPAEVQTSQRIAGVGIGGRLKQIVFPRVATHSVHVSSPTNLVPDLLEDAATRAQKLDPKAVYPMTFGSAEKIALASLMAFAAFSLMPNLELFRTPEQQALAAILQKRGRTLEETAKRALQKPEDPKATETKRLAKKLEKLGQKMQRGRLSKREALTSLGELRKQLENAKEGKGESNGGNLENLEKSLAGQEMQSAAGRDFKQNLLRRDAEAAAKSLEKLADKMERGQLTEKEKQQAAQDLKKAAEALRKSGGKANEDAAKNLEQAAKALERKNEQGNKSGQQGQKQNGSQQQSQNGQQQGQQGNQQQNGQKQGGQQNQQGQSQQGGSQQQQGGQQQQGQNGQQGSQQGGQQESSQGQQGSEGSGQQGSQSGGSQSGADALREAARGMREGQGGGNGDMSEMLDKIREAENDAGQNSGENSGQGSGDGKGEGQGQGEGGEGQSDGTKLSPTDPRGTVGGGAGLGPRNNAQGANSGGGVSKLKGAKSGDKRRWEDVWSDRLPPTQKNLSRINGKLGKGGEMQQLPTRTEAKGGPVKTPYYDVYESYRKDAEDAVNKDAVPPAYKAPVKEYFNEIRPDKP
ncbi:MAG TPA: hypothetical protein VF681_04135 [Abditibacteriaceae bacterium]|jgi:hypothetical protein